MSAESDWDALAAEAGLPADWREQGYDTPEYMESAESIYRTEDGGAKCSTPSCGWRRKRFDVEQVFRHAHSHYKAWKKAHAGEANHGE